MGRSAGGRTMAYYGERLKLMKAIAFWAIAGRKYGGKLMTRSGQMQHHIIRGDRIGLGAGCTAARTLGLLNPLKIRAPIGAPIRD
jgi:hypothetical protein